MKKKFMLTTFWMFNTLRISLSNKKKTPFVYIFIFSSFFYKIFLHLIVFIFYSHINNNKSLNGMHEILSSNLIDSILHQQNAKKIIINCVFLPWQKICVVLYYCQIIYWFFPFKKIIDHWLLDLRISLLLYEWILIYVNIPTLLAFYVTSKVVLKSLKILV